MTYQQPLDQRLHAFRPDLADARLKGQVVAARYVVGEAACIAAPAVPLLRRPDQAAPMDSQLLHGETVQVFERRDGWAWVQADADGYTGYLEETALTADQPTPTHKVVAGQTIILSDKEQIAAPLHTLSLGARLAVAEEGERFHRLATGGYVFAAHLAPLEQRERDWVAVAERLLGLPYLWGGRGHGGVDCSGLVQIALADCGVPVLRDADQQAGTAGKPVSLDSAAWQHGDLIYTKGHVLIARGQDSLIHATGRYWAVVIEDRNTAILRLNGMGLPVTNVRRLSV